MLTNYLVTYQIVCTHSGIEISHEFVRGWDFLDDGVKHSVEVLLDVVVSIKGWCISTDEGGEASLCERNTRGEESTFHASRVFWDALQQLGLYSKTNPMDAASAWS